MSVWRATVKITSPVLGGTGSNTFVFSYDGDDNPQPEIDGLQVADDRLQAFFTAIGNIYCNDTVTDFDGEWRQLDPGATNVRSTAGWAVGGSGGAASLPPVCCLVAGWRTTVPGRSGRGRTFLGPLSVNTLESNGTPVEASRTIVQVQAEQHLIDHPDFDGVGRYGIWSTKNDGFAPIVSVSTRNEFAVLTTRRD